MKSRLLQSASVLPFLLAGPAFAADMPLKAPAQQPTYSWTGFYVGLNAGGAWGRSDADTAVNCSVSPVAGPPFPYFCDSTGDGAANGAAVGAAGSGPMTADGFTGGIQAGYNWQGPSLIYGLETDFDAFHLHGTRQGTGAYPVTYIPVTAGTAFAVNSSFSTDWLYTFRGRIGLPVSSNLMAYATGGLALTRIGVDTSFSDSNFPAATGSANGSETKAGGVIGGGVEWAVSANWSVKAEYLFMDFGKVTATGTISNPGGFGYTQGISTSSDLTAQVARIGINRRF